MPDNNSWLTLGGLNRKLKLNECLISTMLPTFCHMAQLGEATFAYNYAYFSQAPLNAKIPAHNM